MSVALEESDPSTSPSRKASWPLRTGTSIIASGKRRGALFLAAAAARTATLPRASLRHWALLLSVGIGLALRLVNLFPAFFYGDDAQYATVAASLADDPRNLRYPEMESFGPKPFVSQPPLLLYMFALAGRLVGNMELGAILVSVLLGTATIAVVYAIGTLLLGRVAGGLSAIFLAVNPLHVRFSRTALLDVGFGFFLALAILCFLVWSKHRTPRWAWATGASTAATMMSKLPGVIVLVPISAGVLVAAAITAWSLRRGAWSTGRLAAQRFVDDVGRMALAVVLVTGIYLSLLWYLGATRDLWEKLAWQFSRVAPVDGSEEALAGKPLNWYFTSEHYNIFQTWGPSIVLLAVAGVLVLAYLAYRSRVPWPAAVAVAAWPIGVLAFFSLSARKESFYIVPGAPGAALLAGLAAGAFYLVLAHQLRLRLGRRLPRAVMSVLLVVVLAFATVPAAGIAERSVDFAVHRERGFGYGVKEAALFIHEEDPEAGQLGTILGRFTIFFYNGHLTYNWYTPRQLVEEEILQGHVRYVVLDTYLDWPEERSWLEGVVERHNGKLVQSYHPPGQFAGEVRVYELHPDP